MRTKQICCPRQGRRVATSLSFLVIVLVLMFSPNKALAQNSCTIKLSCPLDLEGHFSFTACPDWQAANPNAALQVTLRSDREQLEVVLSGHNSGISGLEPELIGHLTFQLLECVPSLCFELQRSPGGVIVAVLVDV